MKKIGFMVQVFTLCISLPLLTVLELNHVNPTVNNKKSGLDTEQNMAAAKAVSNTKMPS